MKIEIDTESDEFRKIIEKSVVESDRIQEQIEGILETDEIQEILTERIKKLVMSNKIDDVLTEKVIEWVNDFDIDNYENIVEEVTNEMKGVIIKSLKKINTTT